jgi:Ring finger domain
MSFHRSKLCSATQQGSSSTWIRCWRSRSSSSSSSSSSSKYGWNLLLSFLIVLQFLARPPNSMRMIGVVEGMITIVDTHQKFASRLDDTYGRQLWKGYEYYARLQSIVENRDLCPMATNVSTTTHVPEEQNYTVTVPSDGLPVALLVQDGGGCHLEDKINYVLSHIEPAGIVRYLIVTSGSLQHDQDQEQEMIPTENNRFYEPKERMTDAAATTSTSETSWLATAKSKMMQWKFYHRGKEEPHVDVPLYILHVTVASEYDMLDVLLHESSEEMAEGGPRITMDSNHGTHGSSGFFPSNANDAAVWTAVAAMIAACSCSLIMLLSASSDWDNEHPNTPPPARPTRQRLTREQVRRMFPIYRFDGEQLHRVSLPRQPSDGSHHDIESDGLNHHLLANDPPENVMRCSDLDVCSICLDEYEVGDKLRVLPCHHAFHSKCVGKWLSERSAVCPLCKEDLFVPENNDDEEEEGVVNAEATGATTTAVSSTEITSEEDNTSIWQQLFQHITTNTSMASPMETMEPMSGDEVMTLPQQPSSESNTATEVAIAPVDGTSGRTPMVSWWSRMFPSPRLVNTTGTTSPSLQLESTLTEPLLSESEQVDEGDIEASIQVANGGTTVGILPDHMVEPLHHPESIVSSSSDCSQQQPLPVVDAAEIANDTSLSVTEPVDVQSNVRQVSI